MDNVTLIKGQMTDSQSWADHDTIWVDGEELRQHTEQFLGKCVTVRYWVSDKPMETVDDAVELTLKQVTGILSGCAVHHWSEVTGHLWSDEYLKVGGHDIFQELGTLIPDETPVYLLLEVTVHE